MSFRRGTVGFSEFDAKRLPRCHGSEEIRVSMGGIHLKDLWPEAPTHLASQTDDEGNFRKILSSAAGFFVGAFSSQLSWEWGRVFTLQK